jgi:hypothetical protein
MIFKKIGLQYHEEIQKRIPRSRNRRIRKII